MLTIVFDLDGTLIDTAPDLVDTLNHVLEEQGVQPVAFATARTMIGRGARSMIERALAAQGRNCAGAELDRLYRAFLEHYSAHLADRSRPFPQLEAALDRLSAAGHRFAVCTNKFERLSVRLLQSLGLAQRFAAICGPDTFNMPKPNPEVLRGTILQAGGRPARALMIGDSSTDVQTARAASVPVIAVDFGYSDVPVATLQPDRIISSFAELPMAVGALDPQG